MTETEFLSKRRQPATAPHPVGEKRVDHHRHEEPEDDERRELPALSHRAGRDRAGGVHEHHLEEEEREHADVVGVAAQEEALHAEEAEGVAEETDGELAIERCGAAKHAQSTDAAHLQRVAADPVPEHAYRVDHEVHRHGVRGILRAREAGLHHREPALHEHHEEASEQRPHEIDGDLVVTDGLHHLRQRWILGVLDCHVSGSAGRGPRRIARRLCDGALRLHRIWRGRHVAEPQRQQRSCEHLQ